MKYLSSLWLLAFILLAPLKILHAEDQPPRPTQPHTSTHLTKIGAALDQPGVTVTVNQKQGTAIPGKRMQPVRGLFPVTKDFTLYVNGLDINSADVNSTSAKGLEFKIAYTLKGGQIKDVLVESRYVDSEDIPKLQQFIDSMITEAQNKSRDENDHTEQTYITTGGTTFGFVRNGKKDTGYYVFNAPNTVYSFWLKSGNDVAKLKAAIDDAAAWLQTRQ